MAKKGKFALIKALKEKGINFDDKKPVKKVAVSIRGTKVKGK